MRCPAQVRGQLVPLRSRDGALVAIVAPAHGGGLVSLQQLRGGARAELLHRGMNFCPTDTFDGKAPLLWPATGKTYCPGENDLGWAWNGRCYPMPIHGFARHRPWRLVQASASTAVVELSDDAYTHRFYPFAFVLRATYRVAGSTLTIRYDVTAGANREAMPFSIGNHITFALPLGGVGGKAKARLSTAPTRRVRLDPAGRPAGDVAQARLADVPLSYFGREVAVPLAGYRRRAAIAVLEQPGWGQIILSQHGSRPTRGDPVRFNLWGDAEAGYFAVEPWLGRQNGLTTGVGVVALRPHATFTWTLKFRIKDKRAPAKKVVAS